MKPLILIVEDEPAIAENIIWALTTEGFETEWHTGGARVLDFLSSHPVALIVLDIGLPDMNGMELCKAVRASSDVPVIFLTARSDEVDRIVGLEIGGDDYIVKPFSPREFSARIKAVLRRYGRTPAPAEALHAVFDRAYAMSFRSTIYSLNKESVDIRVYITDASGRILFDSARKAEPGADFSQWRDVYLTLRGRYGARSSREHPDSEQSTVLFVAAPVMVGETIAGVVTVAKPTTNINNFIAAARSAIIRKSLVIGGLAVFLSILTIVLITRPVKQLTDYANQVREGRKTVLPRLDTTEIGDMGRAFEKMRQALEDRNYVESYVQSLTHEIKSPVSAIQGAAELLEEAMPEEQRLKFIRNIQAESDRIRMLVDRLLQLAGLEKKSALKETRRVVLNDLVTESLESMAPVFSSRQVRLETRINAIATLDAEPFLIQQAIVNLLQNSADFSSPGDTVTVTLDCHDRKSVLEVIDQGPGIPDFALERVFDKFFSLQRPDTGKKSTGLGLNFVREIAELHGGAIQLFNCPDSGVRAALTLPAAATRSPVST